MRVCYIIPPMPFLADPKRNAPLGTLYLAAATEQAGHSVSVIDWRSQRSSDALCTIPAADVYGHTATTPEYPHALELARRLRAERGGVHLLGGFHASVLPGSIDRTVFHSVVCGEAEESIQAILASIDNGEQLQPVYQVGAHVDLQRVPRPARHLVPEDSFISTFLVERGQPATTLLASRGCGSDCAFCASKRVWNKVRHHTPQSVYSEVIDLQERYGVRQLRFSDAAFTTKRAWTLEMCALLRQAGVRWRCSIRADQVSQRTLEIMSAGGCDEVCIGVESAEQHVLDISNKRTTLEQMTAAVKAANAARLKTRLFLIVGLPGQTEWAAEKAIAFIEETQPTAVDVSTFVPFPGSAIYTNPASYGLTLKPIDWSNYVMTRGLYGDELSKEFVFEHDVLSADQLRSQRAELLSYARRRDLIRND